MAREHLSARKPWQQSPKAGGVLSAVEFHLLMAQELRASPLEIRRRPSSLRDVYGRYEESDQPHGVQPQFEITNTETNKKIWVLFRRQGPSGNAHERICKYFTPGLIGSAQTIGGHEPGVIPFWFIFTDHLATDERYVREIRHWFGRRDEHLLLWKQNQNPVEIVQHFRAHIKPMLS